MPSVQESVSSSEYNDNCNNSLSEIATISGSFFFLHFFDRAGAIPFDADK